MSGHRSFAELTREFTAEHWQYVANKCAELDRVSLLYMSPTDKERKPKARESSVSFYRSSPLSSLRKATSQPPKQHLFNLQTQPVSELMSLKYPFVADGTEHITGIESTSEALWTLEQARLEIRKTRKPELHGYTPTR